MCLAVLSSQMEQLKEKDLLTKLSHIRFCQREGFDFHLHN